MLSFSPHSLPAEHWKRPDPHSAVQSATGRTVNQRGVHTRTGQGRCGHALVPCSGQRTWSIRTVGGRTPARREGGFRSPLTRQCRHLALGNRRKMGQDIGETSTSAVRLRRDQKRVYRSRLPIVHFVTWCCIDQRLLGWRECVFDRRN